MKAETSVERRRSLVPSLVLVCTTVAASFYLFATAPPALVVKPSDQPTVPVRELFAILQAENQAARALWTEEIVEQGKRVGLAFDERWRDPDVEAGPLPALFLRETAHELERMESRLGLFLGSRFPIRAANAFGGPQQQRFATLEETGMPQLFFDPTTNLQTAMFPDRAIAAACAGCHNAHPDSPKRDWKPGDIMGATTWMYPDEQVSARRVLELVAALRASIRASYRRYLEKAKTFHRSPQIGVRWPRDGFFLPSEDELMRELARRVSETTLRRLLDPDADPPVASTPSPQASTGDLLVIRTSRPTRITVERGGHRLLVARLPADGVTQLRSPLPVRISVADPEAIAIEYDGKPIDVPETARADDLEELTFVVPAERS